MFGSMASPLLYSFNRPEIHKTQKRRLNMTNKKSILIQGLLIGTLLLPAGSALADDAKHDGDHHWRKDEKTVITDVVKSIPTNRMFTMRTADITTSPRFDRISKIFTVPAMKSSRIEGSYTAITRS